MQATLWSMFAAILAVSLEWTYRTMPAPWTSAPHMLWFTAAQVLIGVAIYKLVTTPGLPLISAFIVWGSTTIIARVAMSIFVLGDTVSKGTWLAVALMFGARLSQAVWK